MLRLHLHWIASVQLLQSHCIYFISSLTHFPRISHSSFNFPLLFHADFSLVSHCFPTCATFFINRFFSIAHLILTSLSFVFQFLSHMFPPVSLLFLICFASFISFSLLLTLIIRWVVRRRENFIEHAIQVFFRSPDLMICVTCVLFYWLSVPDRTG